MYYSNNILYINFCQPEQTCLSKAIYRKIYKNCTRIFARFALPFAPICSTIDKAVCKGDFLPVQTDTKVQITADKAYKGEYIYE